MTPPVTYVDAPDIPPGMTCAQYRATFRRPKPARRSLFARLLRRP